MRSAIRWSISDWNSSITTRDSHGPRASGSAASPPGEAPRRGRARVAGASCAPRSRRCTRHTMSLARPALRLAGVADRLLVHADQGGEVEPLGQRVQAVALGDEPAHQLLDHERMAVDGLVGGVGRHVRDGSDAAPGRPMDIGRCRCRRRARPHAAQAPQGDSFMAAARPGRGVTVPTDRSEHACVSQGATRDAMDGSSREATMAYAGRDLRPFRRGPRAADAAAPCTCGTRGTVPPHPGRLQGCEEHGHGIVAGDAGRRRKSGPKRRPRPAPGRRWRSFGRGSASCRAGVGGRDRSGKMHCASWPTIGHAPRGRGLS